MDFVIIGGDAAGMSAASRAKRNCPDLQVTVLEKTRDVSYSACGMPYNIADPERPMDDLLVRKAEVFRQKQGINLLTGHCATKIDRIQKTVTGLDKQAHEFTIPYDKLLIATGASPIIPDLPGFNLPGVMVLKSLEDGRAIKQFIKEHQVRKTIIVGMGYIGLEMSEALRTRGIAVDMVKPRPVLLPWLDPLLAATVQAELEVNSVRLFPGHAIQRIESSTAPSGKLRVIGNGLVLEGDLVLVAIGVTPNSILAKNAGLELGIMKAIAVEKDLTTSDPDIYAGGDCADAYHVVTGNKTYVPLALRANRAGRAVADNVCGKRTELPGIAGTAVFKVFGLEVARTGLNPNESLSAGFEPVTVSIKTSSRSHAHPGASTLQIQMTGDKKSGRLLGVQMVGREGAAHRINAAAVALHHHLTVEQFNQSDLAYAPPFSPVWDPLLTAANQLLKEL